MNLLYRQQLRYPGIIPLGFQVQPDCFLHSLVEFFQSPSLSVAARKFDDACHIVAILPLLDGNSEGMSLGLQSYGELP